MTNKPSNPTNADRQILDWITIAKHPDEDRNMHKVCRTGTDLVATDGTRLHIQRGLENYTNPDEDYPPYKQVFPTTGPMAVINIDMSISEQKKLLTDLKLFNKLNPDPDKATAIKLSADHNLELVVSNELITLNRKIPQGNIISWGEFSISLNLTYLIDALSLHLFEQLSITYFAPRAPLLIGFANNIQALVMPLRTF